MILKKIKRKFTLKAFDYVYSLLDNKPRNIKGIMVCKEEVQCPLFDDIKDKYIHLEHKDYLGNLKHSIYRESVNVNAKNHYMLLILMSAINEPVDKNQT